MIFPDKLNKGDAVGVIAPSSPVTKEQADACKLFLEDMGYKVKMGDCTYRSIHGYSSGTGEEKAEEINQMFANKDVKAVWCIRGGDTSSHTMDKIDFNIVKSNPKIFIGFSDITNLHISFNQKCGLITFHGPMVNSNLRSNYDDFTKKSFEDAINMEIELELENPIGEEFKDIVPGKAKGTIVGGNLSLIASMIGTPYEIDTKDKILFIEDVGEEIRRVDRMLYQLKYSKKLQDAAGIIVGDFADCNNESDPNYGLFELLKDIFSDYKKPVMYNIKSGHCYPMSTIPLGTMCIMDTKANSIRFYKY